MEKVNSTPTNIDQLARQLKVLAEPKRLFIIHHLMEGVQCNCELGDVLQLAPNLVSHHLNVLREANLVNVERDQGDGRWIYYSINREVLSELSRAFGVFFDPKRIKPRRQVCGPKSVPVSTSQILTINERS